jgi:hypothetical protein
MIGVEAKFHGKTMTSNPQYDYGQYRADIQSDISAQIQKLGCQPVLFIGSGLTRRYIDGPTWDELLQHLASACPEIKKPYAYYRQAFTSYPAIGQEFAKRYHDWAWSKAGHNEFDSSLFNSETPAQMYIKSKIAERLRSLTPKHIGDNQQSKNLQAEISALQAINPHAIITTNYDRLLEIIFPSLFIGVEGKNRSFHLWS